ncbi:uncharacterized protein [Nicotiana tomentosiformis]|uniref:uncharacterized protein n=1 Tax=Nicotiana tomentosiformis TaxID=4098 RepID=UPI00388C4122
MSENPEVSNVSSVVPTVSLSHEAYERESESPLSPSQNLIPDPQPPTTSSLTQSSSDSHRSRKTEIPKRFVVATSPSASPKKMAKGEIVDGDEGNVPLASSESTLGVNEQEAIDNILLIAVEGGLVGGYEGVNETIGSHRKGEGYQEEGRELVPLENLAPNSTTGETNEGPNPSAQEDPSAPTWDETPYSSKEPQVSSDPARSPHFDAEPLNIVFPKMRSHSEEENENSDEDYDNVSVTSFIAARSRRETPKEPTLKIPTTRLQKKEALESVLKKNNEEKKKRRLVKGGKLVNEEEVPPPLVVDVDEGVNEELGSLIRKSSKKPTVPRPRRESSVKMVKVKNVEVEEFGEKVCEKSSEKLSEKSAKKEKSVRKSVKRKAGDNEELGSSKKAKVGVTKDEGRENLRKKRVLWGRTFAPNILDMTGMRQLVDIGEFQQWTHLFTNEIPKV